MSGTSSESSRSRREEAQTSPPENSQSLVTSPPTEIGSRTSTVRIVGEPTTPADAAKLAEEDKFQFQWWALGLVDARPEEQKKGSDHGIDGKILFRDDPKAATGILISLQPPTGPMESEAASAGFYEHKTNKQKFPRLQLRTVRELMDGKGIERPTTVAATNETFKKAPTSKRKSAEDQELPGM